MRCSIIGWFAGGGLLAGGELGLFYGTVGREEGAPEGSGEEPLVFGEFGELGLEVGVCGGSEVIAESFVGYRETAEKVVNAWG